MSPKDGRISKKKEQSFFELYQEQCNCLLEGAKLLADLVKAKPEERKLIAKELHKLEHRSDEASHKLVLKVSKSFVTPFDRDDMYDLTTLLDDCLDGFDEAASLIVLYKIGDLPQGMHTQVELINKCCELTASVPKTLAKRDKAIKEYWLGINHLENEADQVYRLLLGDLFENSNPEEVFTLIKLKDLIEGLEATIDSFERLAERVEAIIIKES